MSKQIFEELKKYHINKIALDIKESSIIIEMEKDRVGDIEVFLIEPGGFRDGEIQCILKRGSQSKKGDCFFIENTATIYVPFSKILRSINLKPFLGYFSDMKAE